VASFKTSRIGRATHPTAQAGLATNILAQPKIPLPEISFIEGLRDLIPSSISSHSKSKGIQLTGRSTLAAMLPYLLGADACCSDDKAAVNLE
jgi:hypothetical protein